MSYAVPGRVFSLLSEGRSVQDIAQSLALSSKTVSTYRARLLDKLQLRRTTEPIRFPLLDGSRNVGFLTPPTALSHNGSWFDNTAPSCRVGEREEWPG